MLTHVLAIATVSAFASGMAPAAAQLASGTLDGLRDLGPAPPSVRVQIAVVLNYRHDAELTAFVEAQGDPGSRLYHHFLTPAQFLTYFSPTPAAYERVISSLERAGFTIEHTFPNNTVVDATAPAPVAARYFETDIHRVLSPDAGLTYTSTRPGSVPLEIAGLTLGVFGLNDARVFHTRPVSLPRLATRPARPNSRRNGSPLFGPDGGYGPQVFIDAYDLPVANGITGTGRASGVEMSGDYLDSDLAAYLAYFGVTPTGPPPTRIPVDGGAPAFPAGAADETTLDVETIASLAPGTALYVYEIPALSGRPLIDVFNRVVSDNFVDSLNSSWQGCETFGGKTGNRILGPALDAIEKQGSAEGITFHACTGDEGQFGDECPRKVSVNIPASTPHSVAVGGTTLEVDQDTGDETSEVGWNGPADGATGGGVSVLFKVPPYQRSVPSLISRGRNLPDVAFDAGPLTGTSYYFNGAFVGPEGGTSLSSPIFGAALAEINQLGNSRSGYFNPTLYKTWLANGYGTASALYFRDITQGSIPPYYARTGYDQMSGIGAMQVNNFAGLLGH
jgi:subtilase family serine protease